MPTRRQQTQVQQLVLIAIQDASSCACARGCSARDVSWRACTGAGVRAAHGHMQTDWPWNTSPSASGPTTECRSAHEKDQACTALLPIYCVVRLDRFGTISLCVSSSDRALMRCFLLPSAGSSNSKYSGLHANNLINRIARINITPVKFLLLEQELLLLLRI